jgi:hypothetical protein
MVEGLEATCAICNSSEEGGDFSVRKELRKADGAWVSNATIATYRLCPAHFEWAHSLLWTSSTGYAGTGPILGIPMREAGARSSAGGCDFCGSMLPPEAFGIDLVPNSQTFVRRLLFKHIGAIRQHRVCRQCEAWWTTTLADDSAARGTSYREGEGPPGSWFAACASDTHSIDLSPRDEALLATTVCAAGKQNTPTDPGNRAAASSGVLFLGTGRRNGASRVVSRLSPAQRRRTVLVCRPDGLDDAHQALKMGAADLLASPLSPQQVAAAIDRIGLPVRPTARDAATGLPVYGKPISLYGHGGSVIQVQPPRHEDVRLVALLLRRYIRGYDLVGSDGNGAIQAVVFCPPEHVDTVADRIHRIAGERSQAKVLSRAQAPTSSIAAAA